MIQSSWKVLKKYSYLLVYVAIALAWIAVYFGGVWFFSVPILVWVIVPIADILVGEDQSNYSTEEENILSQEPYYDTVVRLFIPTYWITLIYGIWIGSSKTLSLWETFGLIWTLSILCGVMIVVAHELGHRHNKWDKWLAKVGLHGAAYGHFTNEHNKGHHAMVSTPEDPASSRYNQSFWNFLPQTVIGTFKKACEIEAQRLQRLGHGPWHYQNEMYRNVAYPILIAIAFGLVFGWTAFLIFVLQAIGGFCLLEVVNYIEHYGLERRLQSDGRYERTSPLHSWNSNHLITNAFLYHLQRHSDHHAWPARPYQTLRNFEESPQMPTGYAGMTLLALFPPLWFKVMNPKVDAFQIQSKTVGNEHFFGSRSNEVSSFDAI